MPEAKVELSIEVLTEKAWDFLSNLEAVGRCFPFIDRAEKLVGKRSMVY